MIRAVLKWTGWTLAGLAAVVAVLHFFFGLSFELDGTGIRPMASFRPSPDQQMKAIEAKAAEDAKAAPAPAAETAPAPVAAEPVAKPVSAPWPFFYGPKMNGVYDEGPILTEWPKGGLKQLWRRPVGGGYASMTVAQGLIFTIEQRLDQETVAAYELGTGRERWTNKWKAFFREAMGGDGPRATPVWSRGRIYALGAEGEFRCLDAASGKTLWRKNILEEAGAPNLTWGMAASPLIVDSMVVVMPGTGVVAYDAESGAKRWSSLEDKAAYTAPVVATLGGRRQIVAVTASRVVGLSIEEGKLLWEFPWRTEYDVNSTLPLMVDGNRFIISAGYGHGSSLVEVAGESAKEIWHTNHLKTKFNNAVLHQGAAYGLDEGIMEAVDVSSGKRLWKGGRYGYGQILLASGHIIVLTETGDVALVQATPERHVEVARFEALSGKTWNVPAIAEGILLVRNTTEMAAYRIGR